MDYSDVLSLLRAASRHDSGCDAFRLRVRWLITATAHADRHSAASLMESVGMSCSGDLPDECWKGLYERLGEMAASCPDPDALTLLRWHADMRQTWDATFLETGVRLLKGSSFEEETRVLLIGALGRVLRALVREKMGYRLPKFIRLLGFPCARNAQMWTGYGPEEPGRVVPGPCFPTCPQAGLEEPVFDPITRRIHVSSRCSPSQVGLVSRDDMTFIDVELSMVIKSSAFVNTLFSGLRDDPFIRANRGWIGKIRSGWNELRLLVPPPVSIDTPHGSMTPPLSMGAWDPAPVRRYIAISGTGYITTGLLPLFGPADGRLEYDSPFPGRPVQPDMQFSGDVVLYADKNVSLEHVYRLLHSIYGDGVGKVYLAYRNLGGVMRTIPVELTDSPGKSVVLKFSRDGLEVMAPDRSEPDYISQSPYHFTNLRNAAERIRRRLPGSVPMAVRADPSFKYLYLARILGNVTRSTSGRILYERVLLILEDPRRESAVQ